MAATAPVIRSRAFANLYKDSVTLMQLAAGLRERAGIEQASCLMATPANLEQLVDAGLAIEAKAAPSDLLVVVRGEPDACEAALDAARERLASGGPSASGGGAAEFSLPMTSIGMAVEQAAEADLALVSVPGDYAAAEAMKALRLGLHVMLFSDNVAIDEERAIKELARARGLLVMGPDCGTAIINGVPLGFANVVRRGDIGLVAASGTGLQEVTCRIHNLGGGISQALGTGGRDLKEQVGGITMLQGVHALAQDAATRVIVLISKPPAPAIAQQILRTAAQAGKPVVVHFLGAAPDSIRAAGLVPAGSLRAAADVAVALARGAAPPDPPAATQPELEAHVERTTASLAARQVAVRALFTGGTFCYEAQLVFLSRGLACRSNAPAKGAAAFEGRFEGHVFLDLGEDEYTRGRPHPMIDPSLRNEAILAQADDPATAAILFDVVLGYGAHADPARELADTLRAAAARAAGHGRSLALIGHVCGTDLDPQGRAGQIAQLETAGAVIAPSNFDAALLAAQLASQRARA